MRNVKTILTCFPDLPTVIIEPDVINLEYVGNDAELPIKCEVTDSNPKADVTWIKVGETSIYSTQSTIRVGSQNTGEFLCTGLNGVGPSLTASITVSIRGKIALSLPFLHT